MLRLYNLLYKVEIEIHLFEFHGLFVLLFSENSRLALILSDLTDSFYYVLFNNDWENILKRKRKIDYFQRHLCDSIGNIEYVYCVPVDRCVSVLQFCLCGNHTSYARIDKSIHRRELSLLQRLEMQQEGEGQLILFENVVVS